MSALKAETAQKLRNSGISWVKTTFRKRTGRWEMAKVRFSSHDNPDPVRTEICDSLRNDFEKIIPHYPHEGVSILSFLVKSDGYIAVIEQSPGTDDVDVADPTLHPQSEGAQKAILGRIGPDDEICVMRPASEQDVAGAQMWEGALTRFGDYAVNLRAELCCAEILAAEVSLARITRRPEDDLQSALSTLIASSPKQLVRTLIKQEMRERMTPVREIRLEFPANAPLSLFAKEITIRIREDTFPGVPEGFLREVSSRPAIAFLFIDADMRLLRVIRHEMNVIQIDEAESGPDI